MANFRVACTNCHVVLGLVEEVQSQEQPGFYRNVSQGGPTPTKCPTCEQPLLRVK